jgi:hypothetical protein
LDVREEGVQFLVAVEHVALGEILGGPPYAGPRLVVPVPFR